MLTAFQSDYLFITIFLVVSILFPLPPLLIAYWIAPRKPGKVKKEIYECGLDARGDAWVQFRVQYYIYALIFVIFDIEAVFLFPWALAFHKLATFAVVEMFVFLGILVGGLVYAWKKGVLTWDA